MLHSSEAGISQPHAQAFFVHTTATEVHTFNYYICLHFLKDADDISVTYKYLF